MVRIGEFDEVLNHLIESLHDNSQSVDTVWMTEEPSKEELDDQNAIASVCSEKSINFKLWQDEKYFIDEYVLDIWSRDLLTSTVVTLA